MNSLYNQPLNLHNLILSLKNLSYIGLVDPRQMVRDDQKITLKLCNQELSDLAAIIYKIILKELRNHLVQDYQEN